MSVTAPDPSIADLRCFVAAATSTSFSTAARSVALAPNSLSGRLRALEDAVGCALFIKRGRKKVLSPEGERLLPLARRIVDDVAGLSALTRADDRVAPFALTLGTRFELGLSWLVPLLPALERERPERTLHVAFGNTDDLVARAVAGDVDAVITSARLAGARLQAVALHDEDYVFVGAPALLRRHPLRGPRDAAHHTLLDAAAELPLFHYFADAADASEVWSFAGVLHLGAVSAIRLRVLQGRGVAVLPRYLVTDDVKHKRLKVLCPRRRLRRDAFRLVWRVGHPREAELRALAARLAEAPLR